MENRSMENPWTIQCKNHGKNHGKLNGKSMENPWEIHGQSMENKIGKKWNVSLVLHGDQKGPRETGIRFDTKWHHNWLNQLLIWRISIIFRRASFLFSKKKSDLGFLGQKRRIGDEFFEMSVYRKISFPENVEKLSFRCHVRRNRLKICMYDRMLGAVILETPKPPQFQPELSKNRFLWIFGFFSFLT